MHSPLTPEHFSVTANQKTVTEVLHLKFRDKQVNYFHTNTKNVIFMIFLIK